MTSEQLTLLLTAGCNELSLSPTVEQREQLVAYTTELHKWNKTYNLTAVRTLDDIMKRHIFDALSVLTQVQSYHPKHIADIGTGGGIPGVILAIMLPEAHIYLVESIGKKCRFLRHVVAQLGLSSRITVVQQRVEQWQPNEPMTVIICRAFTSLENFTKITQHLGDKNSAWLAMKSAHTEQEIAELPKQFMLQDNITLNVPYETAGRHLLVLAKNI